MDAQQSTEIKSRRGGVRRGAGRPAGSKSKTGLNSPFSGCVPVIKKKLLDHGLGREPMQPSQVKALEVLLDRHEPRLSSIESIQQDPRDQGNPSELLSQLVAAMAANPQLVGRLRQAIEKAEQQACELAGEAIANAAST
jgi:hypothetical protein